MHLSISRALWRHVCTYNYRFRWVSSYRGTVARIRSLGMLLGDYENIRGMLNVVSRTICNLRARLLNFLVQVYICHGGHVRESEAKVEKVKGPI